MHKLFLSLTYCTGAVLFLLAGCDAEDSSNSGINPNFDPKGDDGGGNDGEGGDGKESEAADDADDADETTGDVEPPECNEQENVVLYLSPDDSNSMSSPVQVRERLLNSDWKTLSGIGLRPWEFMNYYNFPYAPAVQGTLAIEAELFALDHLGNFDLQVAVSSPAMTHADRPLMNLTLALDTSGSMQGQPFELLKASCRAISASLKAGDVISMVEWDTENNIRLDGHVVTGPNDPVLNAAIDALEVGGGTDLYGGLTTGYEAAKRAYSVDRINRVVLISDGGANVGVTEISVIAEHAKLSGQDGIYMVGVGVGDTGYHDQLMDDVTDAGKGASVFIGSYPEAEKVFQQNFVNTMAVAARDVHVELTLPPGFELTRFSGEEVSSDPTQVEPQHLAPNDSMVFFQQIGTCAPQVLTQESIIRVAATFKDAKSFEAKRVEREYTFGQLLMTHPARLRKGSAIMAYVDALQAYRHQDQHPEQNQNQELAVAMSKAITAVDLAMIDYPQDPELIEIRNVLSALQGR